MIKIYVLKWIEIFDEFSKKHEYWLEKLEEALWLKQYDNAYDVVTDITNNSVTMDNQLILKRTQ